MHGEPRYKPDVVAQAFKDSADVSEVDDNGILTCARTVGQEIHIVSFQRTVPFGFNELVDLASQFG